MEEEQEPFQAHRFDLQQMLKELASETPLVIAGTTLLSQTRIAHLFKERQEGTGDHG